MPPYPRGVDNGFERVLRPIRPSPLPYWRESALCPFLDTFSFRPRKKGMRYSRISNFARGFLIIFGF